MLLAMAVNDTPQNQRTELTKRTLESLERTVNFTRHRLFICDNGSCEETQSLYRKMQARMHFTVVPLSENRGTAVAINAAWSLRELGEHCVKMDNDVVIEEPDWPDQIELVFAKDPKIGICGLKRKDVWEWPLNSDKNYRSTIRALPHEPGERWLVVEEVEHVIGTCQAYSDALLRKIGFLYQMQDQGNLYGFDDSLAAVRATVAGFQSVFLPHVHIHHIDPGGGSYAEWKKKNAGQFSALFHQIRDEYRTGTRPVYYGGP